MQQVSGFTQQQYELMNFKYQEPGLTLQYITKSEEEEDDDSHEKLFSLLS